MAMSNPVELTIDDKTLSVEAGTTILAAARQAGIDVPSLCAHPRLKTRGSCHVCLVAVEGEKELAAACETLAREGMRVRTDSERPRRARRLAVELLLSDHAVECLSCEGNGECELQALAYRMGISRPAFEPLPRRRGTDDSSPVIRRDMDKCILCGRCVAMCNDVDRHDALSIIGERADANVVCVPKPAMAESRCVSCGDCVQVCPTAALVEKHAAGRGRPWELAAAASVCPFCGVGCGLTLLTRNSQIVRVRGDWDAPANRGSLCARGRFGCTFVNHPDRLREPLIRRAGRLEPVSWDQALDFAAKRLRAVTSAAGQSAGVLGGAACTNETCYILQKFAHTILHTNNIDSGSGYVWETPALKLAGTADCEVADALLVLGADPEATAPVLANAVKRASEQQAALVLVQAMSSGLTGKAGHLLPIPPGAEDAALACIVAEILRAQGLEEGEVRTVWEGLEELAASAQAHEAERAAESLGLTPEQIRSACRSLMDAKRVVVLCSEGRLASGLNNLALLLEGRDVRVCWTQAQNNSVGAALMGLLPDRLPGGDAAEDARARKRLADLWSAAMPKTGGMSEEQMLAQSDQPRLRALYVVGSNPAARCASQDAKEFLTKLDLLICQDLFLTETAQLADVVLPAASFAEHTGTFTNLAGRVQPIHRAFAPPGAARPDWEIVCMLGLRLGWHVGYNSVDDIVHEIAQAVPGFREAISEGSRFDLHAASRPRFSQLSPRSPAEPESTAFPFHVLTAPGPVHWRSGAMSRRSPALSALSPRAEALLSPGDVDALELKQGDVVEVSSATSQIQCAFRADAAVPDRVVVLSTHFSEANPMALLGSIANRACVSVGRVQLRRAER